MSAAMGAAAVLAGVLNVSAPDEAGRALLDALGEADGIVSLDLTFHWEHDEHAPRLDGSILGCEVGDMAANDIIALEGGQIDAPLQSVTNHALLTIHLVPFVEQPFARVRCAYDPTAPQMRALTIQGPFVVTHESVPTAIRTRLAPASLR